MNISSSCASFKRRTADEPAVSLTISAVSNSKPHTCYYVEWHVRQALKPVLDNDEYLERQRHRIQPIRWRPRTPKASIILTTEVKVKLVGNGRAATIIEALCSSAVGRSHPAFYAVRSRRLWRLATPSERPRNT